MWNQNEREGKVDQVKGKIKQAVGNATNDPDLVIEGQDDETVGKIQEGIGTVTRKAGEAIEKVGKEIKK